MLQLDKNKTIVSKKKFNREMVVLSKSTLFYLFLLASSHAMDYVVSPLVGATVTPYMSQAVSAAQTWLQENSKTFDNEFNEAVCGINRDKLKRIITPSLKEFEKQLKACTQIWGNDIPIDFTQPIYATLAQSALVQLQRYELALIHLDFIEHTKDILEEKTAELSKPLIVPYDPRRVGGINAQELEGMRIKDIKDAQKIIYTMKMNLCSALYDRYQYKCEGGFLDRFGRSFDRHHERAKFWNIQSNLVGKVSVPKWADIVNPFLDNDESLGAQSVRKCRTIYEVTVDLIRARLETQIGLDKLDYITQLKEQFKNLFRDERHQLTETLQKPKFLQDYIEFLRGQAAEKQKINEEDGKK
ncbi:MAG: hypothetical protein K0M45_12145 [Candidatus Paracaedibacteraceae bacterium]|nr:hypothetical protein [Candidatus Paracaedibacteraceae bacterium]